MAILRGRNRWFPLAAAGIALALAGVGEALVESGNTTPFSLVLYLAAIFLFTATALPLPLWPANGSTTDSDSAGSPPPRTTQRRVWMILGGGAALAVAINLVALNLVSHDLQQPGVPVGPWLWLLSMIVFLSAGLIVRRGERGAARWGVNVWPRSAQARRLLIAVLILLFVLAAAARLLLLDRVPFGINADEGDRAATAMQILRGTNTQSVFALGWYWVPMLYFWLLAATMKILGIGYVQARVFGALVGIATVGVTTWLGIRNFGLRAGLLAGALGTLLSVSLQFSRETSEAGTTALLWTISMALFLEAARRGRSWAWIGAGLAGGSSFYFYTSSRLWPLLAAAFCLYLIAQGRSHRLSIVRGTLLAALAACLAIGPFMMAQLAHPDLLTLRAQEVSVFTQANAMRLPYYNPKWSTAQLLVVQVIHSVGVFNQFPDGSGGGFWPSGRPLMSGLLAVLTLLGLGWVSLSWRDPRMVALALWFWVGLVGVIVTVETPSVQRMATAIPVLAFLPVLVLDDLARRVEAFAAHWRGRLVAFTAGGASMLVERAPRLSTAAVAVIVCIFMVQEGHFYFWDYAAMDAWPAPNAVGQAVAEQGRHALVTALSRSSDMVNWGWVRLLAPTASRGAIESPGSTLPLALPADSDLAIFFFPEQAAYLPYLQRLYPGGTVRHYNYPNAGLVFAAYRVPRARWAATQGALAAPARGDPQRVATLGVPPRGWTAYPSRMRWTAGLRVPQTWNYRIQIGPGPATLTIDGRGVLTVPAGTRDRSATVMLLRGDHAVVYDGTLPAAGRQALFAWAPQPEPAPGSAPPATPWQPVSPASLMATQSAPRGLYGVVRVAGAPLQRRLDNTLATCCLSDQVNAGGRPYAVTWTGTLLAPTTGVYPMTLFTQGTATLTLDGRRVIQTATPADMLANGSITLHAGRHAVKLAYSVAGGSGALEWTWTPPGGTTSIVPPSVLSPPPGTGVGPPLPFAQLGQPQDQPIDVPLVTVR